MLHNIDTCTLCTLIVIIQQQPLTQTVDQAKRNCSINIHVSVNVLVNNKSNEHFKFNVPLKQQTNSVQEKCL